MILWLLKPRGAFWLYILSLVIGSLWLCFLCVPHFSWIGYRNGSGDLAQHLSGWYAFVYEPWHFPLLKINLLDYPEGTNISMTDSIPLFAVFFKLIRGILPPDFNFFSIFFVFCYLSQAIAATTLAYSLNQKSFLAVIAFTFFAVSAPILSNRVAGEDSLACQAFILFALALYFFNKRNLLSLRQLNGYFGLVIGLSLLVHPYLTAMSYPFYLASVYEYIKRPSHRKKILGSLLITHACLALEFFVFGLGTSEIVGGFGLYNMNLLAPVYGGYFAKGTPYLRAAQVEGFAYLGAGLIALILIAFFLQRRQLIRLLCKYHSLIAVGLLFFIYAIYGHIDWGQHEWTSLPIRGFFFIYDFRSNGRFFWPCSYLLLVFSLVTFLQKLPKFACLIVPLLIALQIFDVQPYFKTARQALETAFQNSPIAASDAKIKAKMTESKLIIYYPRLGCNHMNHEEYNLLISTQLLASQTHTPINTAYTAHAGGKSDRKICDDDSPRFHYIRPQLLISDTDRPSPTMLTVLHSDPSKCEILSQGYYCLYH